MKDKIQQTFTQLTASLRESFNDVTRNAKNKSQEVIDDWLAVFPELESMGLEITSFGVSLAISPSLEVEFAGNGAAFTDDRIVELLAEYEGRKYVKLVLKTIRTTRSLHKKLGKDMYDTLHVKIVVKVPPEVRVYFGRPIIL